MRRRIIAGISTQQIALRKSQGEDKIGRQKHRPEFQPAIPAIAAVLARNWPRFIAAPS
jgi:hypothetical protein